MAQTHHYLFDTATGFNDSTGSINFTAGIASVGSTGKINECMYWTPTGSGNAAVDPSGIIPSFGNPWTIAFWYKATGTDFSPTNLLEFGNVKVKIYNDGMTTPKVAVNVGGAFIDDFSVNVTSFSGWNHIVISYDGTYYWDASVNGSTLSSYSSSSTASPNVMTIHADGSTLNTYYIDDFRVYDSQINNTEVAFIYNSGLGTQANSGGGSGSASGALSTITMYAPSGSASGGPGGASGGLTTITVSSLAGSASAGVDASASGSLSTITMSAPSGIAYPEFIAYGSLPTITVSTLEAIPTITTSIQLDYVACDGEITWTQTLPLTGFASAVQGQDSISSRITPTIGGSGANIVFFEQRTLVASGSYTYDLTSLTDFLGGALSLSRAYAISITPTSGSISLAPGASNSFQWFFASATANISLSSPNVFMFAQPNSATITSGSKTLVVTNTSGAATATYKIAILGGR